MRSSRNARRGAAAGAFFMLSAPHVLAQTGERVSVDGFAIDRTEVTVGQFRAYAKARGVVTTAETEGGGFEYAGGWTRRRGWTWATPYGRPAEDAEPVTHVTWPEASAYCAHAGGRLPNRVEWSKAAYTELRPAPPAGFERGRTYPYPVGTSPEGMNNSRKAHVAVGTTKAGVNGLYDMGANVWEWLADRDGGQALTAGGSWWYGAEMTRAEAAQWKAADFYAVYIGFRCAYDAPR